MAVEGIESAAIAENVLHNHDTFVGSPSIGLGIGNPAMTYAVDRLSEAGSPNTPVLARVESVISISKPTEIASASCPRSIWRIEREIEQVHEPAWRARLPDRLAEIQCAWVARNHN
jgi:hypothetical protein